MKLCLLLFVAAFLFVTFNVSAGILADTSITVNSLPPNGYLPDKGWKFHPGDDLAFGRAGPGLSLTYDMIVKRHGGTIDVSSREGAFTGFIISLPL
jgi:hypothetical protein